MFRLNLFGSACIEGPDGPLTGRAVQRRRLALLALLALARQHGRPRERLVAFLWPDSDPERGRHLLSDSVYRINQAVGGEAVVSVGDELRLDTSRLSCDTSEFLEALERREWQRAVELQPAPFLDGFFLTGADELERWVDAEREHLARERARALEALADAAERAGSLEEAVRWLEVLAGQDPHSSRIALRLMRALERAGDRAAALRHAHAHATRLKEELGLEPDRELVAFVEQLRAPAVTPVPAAAGTPAEMPARREATSPAARPRSVAVLPFVNLSPDPDTDYFAGGITDDVIAQLSKIGALTVLSRASIARFTTSDHSLREIGEALGAATVLGGSVRSAGDRVRIVAQLVDAATSECLWADSYDRRLTDVFAIQTDVALQIASALHAHLSPEEAKRIRQEPTQDLQAYQAYLQGRHCLVSYTDEGMRKSVAYFEKALRLDPNYALAHTGVAKAYAELGETGAMEPDDAYQRARKAALKAVQLDEGLADAHCVLAQLAAVGDFDWAGAEREFKRALELMPGSADTWDLYGRLCSALQRYDEAVVMERRAQELDPLAHRSDYATALIRAGRYPEALDAARRAVDLEPGYDRARATLGWAYLKNGRTEEGLAELEAAVTIGPANTAWLAQLGQAYAQAGQVDRAREILLQLEELSARRYVSPYHMAYVLTGLGERDRAVEALERAARERAGAVYGVKGSFLFTELHSHPRFVALLRRMRLA